MDNDRPEWLFDEADHAGIDYSDASVVAGYDEAHKRFRDFDESARRISEALGLTADSAVLDIGCGTGELTTRFARTCRRVHAVDVSPAMIEAVERKAREQGLENVVTAVGGFLTYEHAGDPLDAVVANVCLHHLPDFWKQVALVKLCDMLKPGGRLFLADVVFGFDPRAHAEEVDAWLAGMREAAGEEMAGEAVVHVRDEFSTWDWVMEGMLGRAGFSVDSSEETAPSMRAYVCTKPEREEA